MKYDGRMAGLCASGRSLAPEHRPLAGYEVLRRPTPVLGPDERSVDAPLDEERALWQEMLA